MNNPKTVQCGACAEEIERTGDEWADYQAFMQHAAVCPKRKEQAQQRARLIEEFGRQPKPQTPESIAAKQAEAGFRPVSDGNAFVRLIRFVNEAIRRQRR